ncbi:MAG: hypothetical protein LPK18_04955 [Pseudomonadaceae bacterium]|nr:hypothetical protein [Pseudomonadaceae bacterium]
MKLTFVPKEDLIEIFALAVCIFCGYIAWRDEDPLGLLFILLFGSGAAYFYGKKNKARWCTQCNGPMTYATEYLSSDEHDVVYLCPKCGKKNRAMIRTNRPSH